MLQIIDRSYSSLRVERSSISVDKKSTKALDKSSILDFLLWKNSPINSQLLSVELLATFLLILQGAGDLALLSAAVS